MKQFLVIPEVHIGEAKKLSSEWNDSCEVLSSDLLPFFLTLEDYEH